MSDSDFLLLSLALCQQSLRPHQFVAACAACRDGDVDLDQWLTTKGSLDQTTLQKLHEVRKQLVLKHGSVDEALSALGSVKVPVIQLGSTSPSGAGHEQTVSLDGQSSGSDSEGHLRRSPIDTADWQTQSRSRYSLTRVHGKGGVGQVWLAHDEHLRREVALKEIRSDKAQDEAARLRLLKEAQITGQLEHPNIIPVYELEFGTETGQPFYTMRFMRGETLRQRIKRFHPREARDPLALRQLLQAFISICNALAYAHARGVIHRDLKPQNVMLGDFGEVIVLDWGLAKSLEQHEHDVDPAEIILTDTDNILRTLQGQVVGTPSYMSPEQADGRLSAIDTRTDIYGLGGILFVILSGSSPHNIRRPDGSTVKDTMELLRNISTHPTPDPREVNPQIPAALSAICGKAMAKNRADRYASASDLAKDVQRWLADAPVSCYSEPMTEKLTRWARRHKSWALAGSLAALVITVVSLVTAVVVESARTRTQRAFEGEQIARQETAEALQAEQLAKQEAVARFRDALNAVDIWLNQASDVLAYFPAVQPVRIELLKQAAKDLQNLAKQEFKDRDLQVEAARAQVRLGDVYRLIGDHERAKTAYTAGLEELAQLSPQPLEPDARRVPIQKGHVLVRLAELQTAMGEYDRANELLSQAFAWFNEYLEQHDSPEIRQELAAAWQRKARLLALENDLQEATKWHEKTLQILDQLVEQTGGTAARTARAEARREAAEHFGLIGQLPESLRLLEQSIQDYQRLTFRIPDEPPLLDGLAGSQMSLANQLRQDGRPTEAIENYRSSIENYQHLLRVRPGIPEYRENMANSHTNLAQILHPLGLNQEAERELLAGLSHFIELTDIMSGVIRYHESKATCYATLGIVLRDLDRQDDALLAFEAAIQEFDALAAASPTVGVYRRRLAVSRMGLAQLLWNMNRLTEAHDMLHTALEDINQCLAAGLNDSYTRSTLAWCHFHLANLYHEKGDEPSAQQAQQQAASIRAKLSETPELKYERAWMLANFDNPEFRQLELASGIVAELIGPSVTNPKYWQLAGLIELRQGNVSQAMEYLQRAVENRVHPDCADHLLLALAHRENGDDSEADHQFNIGKQLFEKHHKGNRWRKGLIAAKYLRR